MKDRAYIVNLHEYKSIGTHWIAFYANGNSVTYFNVFGAGYIPEKINRCIGNKNIITHMLRIQACGSAMFGYFCMGFFDSIFNVKWF